MIDIKSIWNNQMPTGEIIIKTIIDTVTQFKCYAATNHITGNHIYVMEISNNTVIPEFKNFKFQGLRIEIIDFNDFKELNIYLLDNDLKDIFSLFIENILEDVTNAITENEALLLTSNVILKWKKLFDKINFQGLSLERQKGLMGELILFNSFLDQNYPIDNLLANWTGPDYEDKDFIFGSVGVEVKFTSLKIPQIRISSERQLDTQSLSALYLILYATEEVKDKGLSLNSIIEQTRSKISVNHNALKFFNERLLLIGYLEEDIENYNKQYSIKNRYIYSIEDTFPKIIGKDLKSGIINTTYYIELSACESFKKTVDSILEILN